MGESRVIGHYKVRQLCELQLGRGTYGAVYKGCDVSRERVIAAKHITHIHGYHKKQAMAEIDTLKRLQDHANVVQYYDHYFVDNTLWIMMEYCDAGDLNKYHREMNPALDIQMSIMWQCANGLEYIHRNAIVHRDVKPGNILVKRQRHQAVIKMSDFGLAKVAELADEGATAQLYTYCGTQHFMAPELFEEERQPYGRRVDVFSLGLCFLSMILHKQNEELLLPKWDGITGIIGKELNRRKQRGDAISEGITERIPDSHDVIVIKQLIKRMTIVDPAERSKMTEVRNVLCEIAERKYVNRNWRKVIEHLKNPGVVLDNLVKNGYIQMNQAQKELTNADGLSPRSPALSESDILKDIVSCYDCAKEFLEIIKATEPSAYERISEDATGMLINEFIWPKEILDKTDGFSALKKLLDEGEIAAKTTTTRTMDKAKSLKTNDGIIHLMPRKAWDANPSLEEYTNLIHPLEYVVFSHSADTNRIESTEECLVAVKNLQSFAVDNWGFADISYNFLIGNDGLVYEGRGDAYVSATAKGWNTKILSIAFIGKFTDNLPSKAALDVAKSFLNYLVDQGKLENNFTIHMLCDVSEFHAEKYGDMFDFKLYEEISSWKGKRPRYKWKWRPGKGKRPELAEDESSDGDC